jgi:glycosyltransferase involved in cell wall biosynthesis
VYPPVDTDFFRPGPDVSGGYALVVSALVPYKRIDLAIDACQAAGIPLKIVGTGPDRPALSRRAARGRHDTAFLGYRSDEEVRELYRAAQVVLLPGEEDFGIVPLEAQACGRPVVAYARGGARETVIDGETGLLVEEPAPGAFAEAIQQASRHPFDATVIRRHAERFGKKRFAHEIDTVIRDTVASQVRTPAAGSMSR